VLHKAEPLPVHWRSEVAVEGKAGESEERLLNDPRLTTDLSAMTLFAACQGTFCSVSNNLCTSNGLQQRLNLAWSATSICLAHDTRHAQSCLHFAYTVDQPYDLKG
jgi:hypothetical protein